MGRGGAKDAGPHVEDKIEGEDSFSLTADDRHILSITDDEFQPHTWVDLKQIIAENKLETLRRWPSDLERYVKWSAETKEEYGSIPNFVMQKRLKWTPTPSSTPETGLSFECEDSTPFKSSKDYQIMPNDWPYGLDKGIRHVVVWLKTRLETEPPKGELTTSGRALVEGFIQQQFMKPVADLTGSSDNVMWFKNPVALQSVPGLEHVHVLLRNVPDNFIEERYTKGQQPLQDMVS